MAPSHARLAAREGSNDQIDEYASLARLPCFAAAFFLLFSSVRLGDGMIAQGTLGSVLACCQPF
jgi:hypothetical protein